MAAPIRLATGGIEGV